jgi:hypothetical protein
MKKLRTAMCMASTGTITELQGQAPGQAFLR